MPETRAPPTLVFNRLTGRLEEEAIMGERLLRLLYGNPVGRALAGVLARQRWFSRLVGRLEDSAWSARKIRRVAAELAIDLTELGKPVEAYRTFNEFFTRTLRPSARPIDERPEAVISPCDARLLAFPAASQDHAVEVKGSALRTGALLGDEGLAGRFSGGTLLVYRLCPADYHRFHFPETCVPGPAVRTDGRLHSVHPLALGTGRVRLDRNLRERTLLESTAGTVCMVEIGALCVGSIVQTYRPGEGARRGEEKGMFRFGGSTVIVIYEPGRVRVDADILERSRSGLETLVRVGMAVGRYSTGSTVTR
jgi:phosphatidylserine decarboxylase